MSSNTATADTKADYTTSTATRALQLQPYLFFEGQCAEAVEYYRRGLGAKVTMLLRYKDSPDSGTCAPAGDADKVMHASLQIGETTLMASDNCCPERQKFGGFSLSLSAPDAAEAERLFAVLADGGVVKQPLIQTFFASRFGMVDDRFGVSWMIVVQP